jgi:hypothetical protein
MNISYHNRSAYAHHTPARFTPSFVIFFFPLEPVTCHGKAFLSSGSAATSTFNSWRYPFAAVIVIVAVFLRITVGGNAVLVPVLRTLSELRIFSVLPERE